MLHVGLLILKILGILLLSILGLVLLLLCIVLFVPVGYRLDMEKRERFQLKGRVSWLCWVLTAIFFVRWENSEDGFQTEKKICIFGISLNRIREWKKKHCRKKNKPEGRPMQKTEKSEEEKAPEAAVKREEQQEEKKTADLPAVREKSREKKERHRRKRWNPMETFRHICDKIKNIGSLVRSLYRKTNEFQEFWNRKEHVRARQAVLQETRFLWKKSRPRKVVGKVTFGFEDPSWTGLGTGVLSMLYQWYPKWFSIHPDFEREILEGELHIRGRIQIYVLCLIAFRLWRNQDVRQMYQEWKQ